MQAQAQLLLGLVAIGALAASVWSLHRQRNLVVSSRRAAREQFQTVRVSSSNPKYSFTGSTATIVRTEETGGVRGLLSQKNDYVLTIYARNESGEHFMFRSTASEPYVKHVPHTIAIHVLGAAYKAPAESDA
jgi:hypothetical protein